MEGASSERPGTLRGRTLGAFVLGDEFGRGGFGSIYRAHQIGLGREVVVKILRPRLVADETMQRRFLREAKLASAIDHPYAAHVYAFGVEPDGVLWIAMELVRGAPLEHYLAGEPMPLKDFVPLLEKLCEVVQTAHEHGIIHRDIKPSNVMVIERAGALLPKLLDLGIAKDASLEQMRVDVSSVRTRVAVRAREPADESAARKAIEGTPTERDEALTGEGEAVGSPAYMAPEQWTNADQVDARADIYSLGVLAYEAISGRKPFNGTVTDLALKHYTEPLPPLRDGLPEEIYEVLAKATAKEPENRWASAIELARAFRKAAGFGLEARDLPALDRAVSEMALHAYPQPIAEAVSEMDAAPNAYRGLDAAAELVRVCVRFLAVVAIASWKDDGAHALPRAASDLLAVLRKRRLADEEWLELLSEMLQPFAARPDEHPVPELVALLVTDRGAPTRDAESLLALVKRAGRERGGASSRTEQAAVEELAAIVPKVSLFVAALSFLAQYWLVSPAADDLAEPWVGLRRKQRAKIRLGAHARQRALGEPLLVHTSRSSVALAPLAIFASPGASAEPEMFMIEGRHRRGMVLVALPGGFEQTHAPTLEWLNRVAAFAEEAPSGPVAVDAPYRGLSPLTAADSDLFFGREREVETFLNRLRVEPLLVVVGASGAGKSSFVRAGVVPSLPESFDTVVLRPGARPIAALLSKLGQRGLDASGLSVGSDPAQVAERVHALSDQLGVTLVLVVDQFEEVFTQVTDAEERAAYCAWLACIARSAADPARVVLTLRDDFLGRAQGEPALQQRLSRALELLSTPGPAELRRILVEPARRAGFEFESDALVDEMIRSVEARPGALALLSFAASRLWEQRDRAEHVLTAEAYHAMGGVAGALAQHGEAVLTRMTATQRSLVREAFRRLVTAEGTRATTEHGDLVSVLGGDDAARAVVEQLVAARLLVLTEGEGGVEQVELIHEALLGAWPRLAGWRREDAEHSRLRDQIRAAAQQWTSRRRPRGLLWRDEALDEVVLWRKQNPGGLTPDEEAFCQASLAERDRGRRIRGALVIALVLALLGVIAVIQGQRARADAHAASATHALAESHLEQARMTFLSGDPHRALVYLEEARRLGNDTPGGRYVFAAAARAIEREHLELRGHTRPVYARYSPDFRTVITTSMDGSAKLWDAASGRERASLRGHTGPLNDAAFSPDGSIVITTSADGTARVWDVATGALRFVLTGHTGRVRGAEVSADGARIATRSGDGTSRLWDARTGAVVAVIQVRTAASAFTPDGQVLATCSDEGACVLSRASDGAKLRAVDVGKHALSHVVFSANGELAALACDDSSATYVVDAKTWTVLGTIDISGSVTPPVFSSDSSRLATTDSLGTIKLVRARKVETIATFQHGAWATYLAFSKDGAALASGGSDGAVTVWDGQTGERRARFQAHSSIIMTIAFDPTGKRVLTGSMDASAAVWDATDHQTLRELGDGTGAVEGAAFDGAKDRVVSASRHGEKEYVKQWDAESGAELGRWEAASGLWFGRMSPDGKRVLSGGYSGVHLEEVGAGKRVTLTEAPARTGTFSPDGRSIVVGGGDGIVRIFATEGGPPVRELRGDSNSLHSVAVNRAGDRLATGGQEGIVRLWDLRSGMLLRELKSTVVYDITFSPDGARLAASMYDGTVNVWRTADGVELGNLSRHGSGVTSVRFSPDGELIATGGADKMARIWDGRTYRMLDAIEAGGIVNDVSFRSDGKALALAIQEGESKGRVRIVDVHRDERAFEAAAQFVRCTVPYRFEGGEVVRTAAATQGCDPSR